MGAAGRLVEEPTVVPGADLSATRELFHGAQINITRAATKAAAPIPASRPVPIPRSGLRLLFSISFSINALMPTGALGKGAAEAVSEYHPILCRCPAALGLRSHEPQAQIRFPSIRIVPIVSRLH